LREGPEVRLDVSSEDGDRIEAGRGFLRVHGPVRSILRLERISLNFLQRLCGIASSTRRWADAVSGTGVVLLDTRKTTPGWRRLEKYAVRAGGGTNHRSSLSEAILVKDNHEGVLRALGRDDVREWVRVLRAASPGAFLQLEVANRQEFLSALEAGVDSILLDNFTLVDLRWAVETRRALGPRGPSLEASGGIRLESVRQVATLGIDRISVGALTHSSVATDLGLDLVRVHAKPPSRSRTDP